MTSQSINTIHKLLHRLTKESTHYYVEEKHIVSRSTLNGHTFYSRFKRFEGPITQTLIEQHLNKTLTLAIALKSDDLVFEYSGEHMIVFASLLQHLAQEFGINNLTINQSTQVTIKKPRFSTEKPCVWQGDSLRAGRVKYGRQQTCNGGGSVFSTRGSG